MLGPGFAHPLLQQHQWMRAVFQLGYLPLSDTLRNIPRHPLLWAPSLCAGTVPLLPTFPTVQALFCSSQPQQPTYTHGHGDKFCAAAPTAALERAWLLLP